MELYHCSPTAGLTVLLPNKTKYFGKPKQVCLTALKSMALLYGIRHFEYTYGYTEAKDLVYYEYFPGALEELYRGKSASLYRCIWREDMKTTQIPNEYVTAAGVAVAEESPVPDLYAALLEQEQLKALQILRWDQVSERMKENIRRVQWKEIVRARLLEQQDSPRAHYMKEKYPESWAMALEEKRRT